jgi:hypothetical protein
MKNTKPDVAAVIRGEFQKASTLTVRQIRAINPELDNANLVRKGFKALIAEDLCTLEGTKRGSKYVRKP